MVGTSILGSWNGMGAAYAPWFSLAYAPWNSHWIANGQKLRGLPSRIVFMYSSKGSWWDQNLCSRQLLWVAKILLQCPWALLSRTCTEHAITYQHATVWISIRSDLDLHLGRLEVGSWLYKFKRKHVGLVITFTTLDSGFLSTINR